MFRLLLLFTLLPLVELGLLLRVGEWLGLGPTLGLVIGTGIIGAWLARREGLRTWGAVRRELSAGRMPGEELLHALMVLLAGVVLVTPGVLTDLTGLLLLVRPVRRAVVRGARRRLAATMQMRTVGVSPGESGTGGDSSRGARRGGRVIDI